MYFLKRFFDIIFSAFVIILIFPFLFFIIIILLFTGENKVFYTQKRVGYKKKKFMLYKFATMLQNSENLGSGSITLRDDFRVLPFGVFLRKTKINEFPQLLNVIKGNMSVVGPRPLMEIDFLKYSDEHQSIIYNVRPGLTGIASVIFRDEEKWISEFEGDPHEFVKDHLSPYKGELEIWYQNNFSILTDFKIVLCSAWVVFFPNSKIVFNFFKNLPPPPNVIK